MGGGLLLAAWAAGASTWGLWLAQAGWGWRPAVGLLALAGAAAAAWAWWRGQPADELAWDGQRWLLGGGEQGRLAVALDLQVLLLVRWDGEAGRRWLWLERGGQPHRWAAVRRAVYSPAVPQAPGAAPSARP